MSGRWARAVAWADNVVLCKWDPVWSPQWWTARLVLFVDALWWLAVRRPVRVLWRWAVENARFHEQGVRPADPRWWLAVGVLWVDDWRRGRQPMPAPRPAAEPAPAVAPTESWTGGGSPAPRGPHVPLGAESLPDIDHYQPEETT